MNGEAVVIVMAEDDPGHASLIQRNLRRGGFLNEIVHLPDGQETLDFIHSTGKFTGRQPGGPLLLILDIRMPRVDGIEVLRQIKFNRHTGSIPVIMLTTTDAPNEVSTCYSLGCNVYITKPVNYEAFVEAIRRLGLFLQVVTVLREDEIQKG